MYRPPIALVALLLAAALPVSDDPLVADPGEAARWLQGYLRIDTTNPPGNEGAAVELLEVFPDAHPRVSTAARLSATFPYVTPAARALPRADLVPNSDAESLSTYHVVDGGYADNEGAVTSVDWMK